MVRPARLELARHLSEDFESPASTSSATTACFNLVQSAGIQPGARAPTDKEAERASFDPAFTWYGQPGSNRHALKAPDFKSGVSTCSTMTACQFVSNGPVSRSRTWRASADRTGGRVSLVRLPKMVPPPGVEPESPGPQPGALTVELKRTCRRSVWYTQRESNLCFRLERAAS